MLINEHESFPLASVAKMVTAAFAVEQNLQVSQKTIKSAIAEHSSEAYKTILRKLSSKEVNQMLQTKGMQISVHSDNTNKKKNCGTPLSVFNFLKWLQEHEMPVIMEALRQQNDPDGFRFQRFSPGCWFHMTGGMDGVCNDVGYWVLPDRIITCAGFLKCSSEVEWTTLERKMRQIGELVNRVFGNHEGVS